jgi:hypothetical protein
VRAAARIAARMAAIDVTPRTAAALRARASGVAGSGMGAGVRVTGGLSDIVAGSGPA